MYSVLIIDDSPSMRRIIKDMINSIDEFEVVCVANDAYDAREKNKRIWTWFSNNWFKYAKMDGVTFLRNLMRFIQCQLL